MEKKNDVNDLEKTQNSPENMQPVPEDRTEPVQQDAARTVQVAAADIAKDPKSFLEAPYSFSVADSESVSINNGGLQLTVTDFVLPGKNGFDLAITRSYSSDNANKKDWGPVPHSSYITDGLSTEERDATHNTRTYGLGYGWSFVLPSIEAVPISDRKTYITYSRFLHLEDGRTLTIDYFGTNFDDYTQKDVAIFSLSDQIRHPVRTDVVKSFTTYVAYKNGNTDYFQLNSSTGTYNLVARQDKFGNTICFTITDYGGMHIVDSWGRDVRLIKAGDNMTWTLPDGGTVVYTTSELDGKKLTRVRDQMGRFTQYDYYFSQDYSGRAKFATESAGDHSRIFIPWLLLRSFTHPTGAVTSYEYGTFSAGVPLQYNVGTEGGFQQKFPVRRRVDTYGGANYNNTTYSYALSGDGKYIQRASVQLLNSVVEKHNFNDKSRLARKEVRHGGALVFAADHTYGADKTKGDYKLPIREASAQYNRANAGLYLQKVTSWQYDTGMKGNVIQTTEEYPQNTALNQVTKLAYGAYNIVTERSYLKDSATTIYERYALRQQPDSKVVEFKRVYENNMLKEKTQYFYGSQPENAYCVIQQRNYYTANQSENLETSGRFYTVSNTYSKTKYISQPVSTERQDVVDAEGKLVGPLRESYDYDACGRMTRSTNALGYSTDTVYDRLGRAVLVTYPPVGGVRHTQKTEYDDILNRITTTDENGHRQRLSYTPLGKISQVHVFDESAPNTPLVLQQQFGYDASERVTQELAYHASGAVKSTTNFTYDTFDRVLTKQTPEVNYAETHVYTDAAQDPEGGAGRYFAHQTTVTGETGAPNVVSVTYADQAGNTVKEYLAGQKTAQYGYDKVGNKTAQTDARANTTNTTYDWAGNVTSTARTVGGVRQTSTTRYDALGNKVESIDYLGQATQYTYDSAGRLLRQVAPFDAAQQATTKFGYDAAGNLTWQRVWAGKYWRNTEYWYDGRGRQTDVTLYEDEQNGYNRTHTVYDGVGNKLEMHTGITFYSYRADGSVQGAHVTRYTYDRYGNVASMTDALGQREVYEYDALGVLLAKTDRGGSRTQYQHDALGRLTRETVTAETRNGQITSERTCAYYRGGQKKQETRREVRGEGPAEELSMLYEYDARGRLVKQTDPDAFEKHFEYDANGNRTRLRTVYGGGTPLELWYTYDAVNRLAQVWTTPPQTVQSPPPAGLLAVYEYDANGNRKRLWHPQTGIEAQYEYNRAGLMTSLVNKQGSQIRSQFTYSYTPDGNQVSKRDDKEYVTYAYDRLGRLVREEYPSWQTLRYSYDAYQNRSTMQISYPPSRKQEGTITTYDYDANNRLLTETKEGKKSTEILHYEYDANGNQVRKEREEKRLRPTGNGQVGILTVAKKPVTLDTREYNGFGQMVTLRRDNTLVRYAYRPDGLRHSKAVQNALQSGSQITTHHWDGQDMVLESQQGQVKSSYVRGVTLIAQVIDLSLLHYLFNAHGDVVQRVGTNGDATPAYEYDAFGNQKEETETDPNPFRYCGEYWDGDAEEIYLRARTYNPANGRFTSSDPARSGNNWYAYCGGNPVRRSDSSGMRYDDGPPGDAARDRRENEKKKEEEKDKQKGGKQKSVNQGPRPKKTAPSMPAPYYGPGSVPPPPVSSPGTTIDISDIPSAFIGEPNSTRPLPNGGYRHFGPDGIADYDYHGTNHGGPKYHPEDENGGHYNDWDYDENGKPVKGKPYIKDKDGNKSYDPQDKRNQEDENTSEFSWENFGIVVTLILLGILIVLLIVDDLTGIGIADDPIIPFIFQIMENYFARLA